MKPKTTRRLNATDGVYKRIVERHVGCRPLVSAPSEAHSIMSRTHTQTIGAVNVPRDPSAISPTEHFLRRYSDEYGPGHETRRNPEITDDVIERCITEGVVSHGRDGTILYETTVGRHSWRLVVGFDNDAPVVVTAYVPGVHGVEKYGGGR